MRNLLLTICAGVTKISRRRALLSSQAPPGPNAKRLQFRRPAISVEVSRDAPHRRRSVEMQRAARLRARVYRRLIVNSMRMRPLVRRAPAKARSSERRAARGRRRPVRERRASRPPAVPAWRGRRCTRAGSRIWRRPDYLRRARKRRSRRRRARRRTGSSASQRSVAPVFLPTSVTIFVIVASISASVSVRSRGCKVTDTATDL